jgi:transcriptional regulator with XRE-family HTH domain
LLGIFPNRNKTLDAHTRDRHNSSIVSRNKAILIAIIESEKDHGEVAGLAKIHPTRLSQIISNRVTPTESEKLRLAGVLQRAVSDLFPEVAA